MKAALGLDFGTESVRAMLVDLRGKELASVAVKYPHGQIIETLPGSKRKLPPHYALQHPLDWLGSAAQAARSARRKAKIGAADVIGVGVDFTSCTMLPTKRDGTPLCMLPEFAAEPQRRRPPTGGEVLVTLRRCHRAGVVLPEDA
jgi:L-ribulokinase